MIIIGLSEHIINIYRYRPFGGGSYIDLPKAYAEKNEGVIKYTK